MAQAAADTRRAPSGRAARKVLNAMASVPPAVAGLVLVAASLFILQPAAASALYVSIILRQAAPLGVLALGQSLVVGNRSIDLSVGGVIALVNVVLATGAVAGGPAWMTLAFPLLIGGLVGLANGLLVARIRASAVVTTLGMGLALSGASLIVSGGAPGGSVSPMLTAAAHQRVLGLPSSALLWLGLSVLTAVLARATAWGLASRAYGNAPKVAHLSGLDTVRILIIGHVLSGLCAGLSGLLLTGYIGTGTMRLGEDLVLASIAATILGGVTFAGGRGGALGVAAGALLLAMLGAELTILGVGPSGKLVVTGVVIAGAAIMATLRR